MALRLGLTSFGGPIAHLGYFRAEYVERRRWVGDDTFADLVALCQFLPGPASSEVGISLGILRAGLLGGLAAWAGFTLPSAALLIAFAYAVHGAGAGITTWMLGLKVVAVAVVAQAVWGMARSFCTDALRIALALGAAVVMFVWPIAGAQVLVIVVGGLIGWRLISAPESAASAPLNVPIRRQYALAALAGLLALLFGLPLLQSLARSHPLAVFTAFFRVGALVFGGGHVVLPLLQVAVVPSGWVTNAQFVTGYGAAQAVPGPLFTFAAYLGAVMRSSPSGAAGGMLALVAIFLPAFLLVMAALPFWGGLRTQRAVRSALAGVNAAVVGLLLAALYKPIWTSAIHTPIDVALALGAFVLLMYWRLPPWMVVLASASAGVIIVVAGGR